eukprot:10849582-Alexandrium_andersonii.AAC.1
MPAQRQLLRQHRCLGEQPVQGLRGEPGAGGHGPEREGEVPSRCDPLRLRGQIPAGPAVRQRRVHQGG